MEEPTSPTPIAPSISSVSVTDITDTSARIDVDSDEVVQGYVEYGTTEQYGMSTPLTSEFSTSPSFLLENLSPETLYHYRVIVMDSSGTAAITGDETFTTLAAPEPEPEPEQPPTQTATTTPSTSDTSTATSTSTTTATTTPPAPALAISNTETASVSTSTARITWQTNKEADGQVQYGTTNTYGTLSPLGTISTSHSVSLSNLVPNTKYYYRAISKTSSGETAYSPAETFTTLAVQAPPSPPVISNVSTSVSTTSATITWTTSKPATSDIRYGTTTSYASSLGKDSTLKTSHSRTISNLHAGTLYHFRIVVSDSAGTTALGKDRTFTTTVNPSAPVAPAPAPVATSTANTDTLKKIAEQGAQAAATASRGGGGVPVAPTRPLLSKVTSLDGQVAFDWRKDRGGNNGTINTLVIRKEGTDPVRSRIDGDIIYDGPSTTFTDTGLENGKEYHYALYSYGAYGRFTTAARFKVVPQADKEQVDLSAAEAEETVPLTFVRDLHVGRQGDDVAKLQAYLAGHGFYPEALITGYFGSLTQKAAIRFQKLNDITPAVGYVGPITREVLKQ
ncbi:fibronectin type III domain-containing protein [Candidatus Kaiserbacteria bacterium]|nr:fibronectin type III domain-containing protein [Candidatus Kaiserbacteria bacterium]